MPDAELSRLTAALANRYRIGRELGKGGMATVYLAEDVKHHRQVAVKVLLPELARAVGPDRFLREIDTTAQLQHPHILPLYDSGEADGFLYYVMPYVEGESLRDRLDREKQLPLDDALGIAREVADALSFAHSRGIVHRDVKPENILLASGHAVVADFGIARAVSEAGTERLTATGMAVGTPAYMSPEQASGESSLDGRSDLYSLACVLYEMLAGQPPFTGGTAATIVRQHLTAEARPISQLRPAVPPAIADVLARALAKNPADRFSPAAHFAAALTTPAPIGAAPASRGRSRMTTGAVVILFAAAAAVMLLKRPSPAPAPAVGHTIQVTREPGLEVDPALSPDGAAIAYAAGPTNAMQIYVRQVSGGRPVALTSDTADNFRWPRWSPDGSQIAYQSNHGIQVVPALGGAPRNLTRVDPNGVAGGVVSVSPISGFDWSPDGTRIAWTSGYGDSVITIVPLNGGTPTALRAPLAPSAPAWSPDGRRIAVAAGNPAFVFGTGYFGNSGAGSVWIVPLDGSGPKKLTSDTAVNLAPQWSADGHDLFWISDRDGSRDVYQQVLRDGLTPVGAPRRVTTGTDAQGLSVSRRGARMAYSRLNTWSSMWSIPVPTRGPVSIRGARRITTGNEIIEDLDVSSDGRFLVFDSDRDGHANLYVMPTTGGEARQITTGSDAHWSPDWSPDGRRIVFHMLQAGNRDIYTIDADGTGLRRWTSDPDQELDPDWAPDGQTILYEVFGNRSGFEILRLADGAHPQFIEIPKGDFGHWAPVGRMFVYHAGDGLRVRHLDTGADSLVVSNVRDRAEAYYAAWAPDGKQIYYMTLSASGWTIRSVAASGGASRVLVNFDDPTRQHTKYGFCTDGKFFYVTIGAPESDIYVADLEGR
jgi:eukaryotic-like serine/threonine-protein kinase